MNLDLYRDSVEALRRALEQTDQDDEMVRIEARHLRYLREQVVYAVPDYADDEVTVIGWLCMVLEQRDPDERLDGWLRTRPDMSAEEIARKVVKDVCHGCDDEYLVQGESGMYRCPECTHREIPLGSTAAFYYGPLVEAPS